MPRIFEAVAELANREEFAEGIPYPKFLSLFTTGLIANHSKDQIKSMFSFLDDDGSGTIQLDDMKRLVKDIGESVTMEELKEIIEHVSGGNSEISFEAFYNIFKKSTALALK